MVFLRKHVFHILVVFLVLAWPLLIAQVIVGGGMPTGSMVFSDGGCPAGTSEVTAAQGRYIVATPSGGTQGGTLGTAMADLADSTFTPAGINGASGTTNLGAVSHSHSVISTGGSQLVAAVSPTQSRSTNNASVDPDGAGHNHPAASFTGTSDNTHRSTQTPYIQLRLCEK